MRGMKRVALSGRAVVATIHQPSIVSAKHFLVSDKNQLSDSLNLKLLLAFDLVGDFQFV